jgi:hypothetical protein
MKLLFTNSVLFLFVIVLADGVFKNYIIFEETFAILSLIDKILQYFNFYENKGKLPFF